MNLLKDNPRKIYLHYLIAAFGSALIVSAYSLVDAAMIGQYAGPNGVAAVACVSPIWNIIYSAGMLIGIGGSVLMATAKGRKDEKEAKNLYTIGLILALFICFITWFLMIYFQDQLLILFGADEVLLPIAKEYLFFVNFAMPLFTFAQFLIAYVRNDNAPMKATIAILTAGVLNAIGDYLCVFVFDMGVKGAGLATAFGQFVSTLVLCSHYFSKKNTLTIIKPTNFIKNAKQIIIIGFPVFIVDIAMGVLAVFMNNQIMTYFNSDALAVYGVILNANILVQASAYAIGQASQPLISNNLGAKNYHRIESFVKLSLITIGCFTLAWMVILMTTPTILIKIFMEPTESVLNIAPHIMRTYYLSYIFMTFNVFMTYYLQALLKQRAAFVISLLRGVIVSCSLVYFLPMINQELLWYAMPICDFIIFIIGLWLLIKCQKEIKKEVIINEY